MICPKGRKRGEKKKKRGKKKKKVEEGGGGEKVSSEPRTELTWPLSLCALDRGSAVLLARLAAASRRG